MLGMGLDAEAKAEAKKHSDIRRLEKHINECRAKREKLLKEMEECNRKLDVLKSQ